MFWTKALMDLDVPDVLAFRSFSSDLLSLPFLSSFLSRTSRTSGTTDSHQRVSRSGCLDPFRNVVMEQYRGGP
jgi:hypothetical protein